MSRIAIAGVSVLALGLFAFALASIARANEVSVQVTEVINTGGSVNVHAEARATGGESSRVEVRTESRGDGSPIRIFKSVEGDAEVRIEVPKDKAFISTGAVNVESDWEGRWPLVDARPFSDRLQLFFASTTHADIRATLEARMEAFTERFATRTEASLESEGRLGFFKWFARLFSTAN